MNVMEIWYFVQMIPSSVVILIVMHQKFVIALLTAGQWI